MGKRDDMFWNILDSYRKNRSDQIDSFRKMDEEMEKMRLAVTQSSKNTIKLGLDFHGVIKRSPELLSKWSAEMVLAGHEVHIMTGSVFTDEFREELLSLGFKSGVNYTHSFSVTTHNIQRGVVVSCDDQGRPYMDKSHWDRSKGDYAALVGLTALWDDSPVYGRYFPSTSIYLTFAPENFLEETNWVINGRASIGR